MIEIPLQQPCYDEAEIASAARVIRAQGGIGGGRVCAEVEAEFRCALQVGHVFLTTSGSHALEISMMALEIGAGDEVILPSFTFSSCANAIVLRGATPVFADVQPRLMTLDPLDVARKVTARTRAIMPVHYSGIACDMEALQKLSEDSGVPLIEDAAQAVFARYRERFLGTIGQLGCLSFHHTKNLGCGEGGALLTNDDTLAAKAEIIREKGTNRSAFLRGQVDKYTWVRVGSSYVLSDVLAAILQQQLAKQSWIKSKRAEHWLFYRHRFDELEKAGLIELPETLPEVTPNYHLFVVFTKNATARDLVISRLRSAGIGATFHYIPLHSSPFGSTLGAPQELPVTDDYAARLIRLPLYPTLSDADRARVADAFVAAVTEYA
ncbi:MAG: dTDP-4-amino-4,6-dideoxygalactose transaminase [Acidobacteria bacterium]|nr:dTDP-4-amino-4,6-dideoxygalactose transaminase [Acidobacteriota bacterium]